jgi:hypothetical protein
MPARARPRHVAEFGDFQTPPALAARVCRLLARRGPAPAAIVEPACGVGRFLLAALDAFPDARRAIGLDINPAHVAAARAAMVDRGDPGRVQLLHGSAFEADWPRLLRDLPEPILVLGNPPWVTSAGLGAIGGANRPPRSRGPGPRGLDAITGKSNFDISEWMIARFLEWLDGQPATLAMLCKAAVARRVLAHAWGRGARLGACEVRAIDAAAWFGAAVDACLLVCDLAPSPRSTEALVFDDLDDDRPSRTLGYRDGRLIGDGSAYERWRHLEGPDRYRWRSGIKHDCAAVMELRGREGRYRNGLGEEVELEPDYLYPLRKGSEVVGDLDASPSRWLLVPQRTLGEATDPIRERAPKTWAYLEAHADRLDRRASAIYRDRPRFSVFGVGDYAFAPWKVATPCLAKRLRFAVVPPVAARPTVLDDTSAFVPCQSEAEARGVASLLDSEPARAYLGALIAWDAKRPITIEILRSLSIASLARELGTGPL